MLQDSHPRSSRGVSGDDPEGGAGSGVLRRAARNRSPREARDPALQALRPGCEELAARIRRHLPAVVGRRAPKETEARPREPKTATVERREASVPRHGTQGASQAPGVPRYVHAQRVPLHPNDSRRSASNSIKQLNQLGNYCRFAAIPAFFPVRKQHNALNSTREPGHVHHEVVRHHTLSRRHLASGANRCIRHHPPANFDSCSTG